MPDTTVILALEGEVRLNQFVEAVQHFQKLLWQLTQEVANSVEIQWELDDLQYGSALMAVAGHADDEETVLKVIAAFEQVAYSLQHDEPIPYSRSVLKVVESLTKLIGGEVRAMRLSTAKTEAILYAGFNTEQRPSPKPMVSFGSVKGRVQSISNRGKLRFTLYDVLFDKPVSCFVDEELQATLTDIWDEMVWVTGRVTRQPDTGQAFSVREISHIERVRMVSSGSYRQARGILAGTTHPEPAEVSIRRLRDAEG